MIITNSEKGITILLENSREYFFTWEEIPRIIEVLRLMTSYKDSYNTFIGHIDLNTYLSSKPKKQLIKGDS